MIVVVGVSHKTAPIDLRERLALSSEAAADLCAQLVRGGDAAEAFAVSTCNRVEVIAAPAESDGLERCAEACLAALCLHHPEVKRYAYCRLGVEGMRHLVKVASSLDSLVVGEPQILGQLKQGFETARQKGTVGATLHRAFSSSVRGAKRVRNETNIGAGQVSVPSIGVQLASQIFGDLRGHTVALVGSGEMGKSVARLLADQGARLIVVGRSLERLKPVTDTLGGEPRLMADLPAVLAQADVIVCSTSAPGAVITAHELSNVRRLRRGRNLFLIDLAVPRDVESSVEELDGVFLYNIDDLSQVASASAETRRREAERALELIELVVERWQRWSSAEQATPTIKALRARMRLALETEMHKSLRGRLRDLDEEQRKALGKMLDAGINRLLHTPTVRLREEAGREEGDSVFDLLAVISELFELDELPAELEKAKMSGSVIPAPLSQRFPESADSPAEEDESGIGQADEAVEKSAACAGPGFSGA